MATLPPLHPSAGRVTFCRHYNFRHTVFHSQWFYLGKDPQDVLSARSNPLLPQRAIHPCTHTLLRTSTEHNPSISFSTLSSPTHNYTYTK